MAVGRAGSGSASSVRSGPITGLGGIAGLDFRRVDRGPFDVGAAKGRRRCHDPAPATVRRQLVPAEATSPPPLKPTWCWRLFGWLYVGIPPRDQCPRSRNTGLVCKPHRLRRHSFCWYVSQGAVQHGGGIPSLECASGCLYFSFHGGQLSTIFLRGAAFESR